MAMDNIVARMDSNGNIRRETVLSCAKSLMDVKNIGGHSLLWMDGDEKRSLVCFDCSFHFSFSTDSLPAKEERLFRKWGYGEAINESCDGDGSRLEVSTSTDERRMNIEVDITHPVKKVSCSIKEDHVSLGTDADKSLTVPQDQS